MGLSKLRNFRAGIEAGVSCLKRAYGLARCTWRGLAHFKAYVWSSVVAPSTCRRRWRCDGRSDRQPPVLNG
jgi:IS5 family transposase